MHGIALIKQAVIDGLHVYHENTNYEVIRDKVPQFLIVCRSNGYCIGLHNRAEDKLNGNIEEFFIPCSHCNNQKILIKDYYKNGDSCKACKK